MTAPKRGEYLIDELLEAPDYAALLRRALADCKRAGLPFAEAWAQVLDDFPPPPGYGATSLSGATRGRGERRSTFGVESPIAFIRRHFEAAYHGERAAIYCVEDCDVLAVRGSRRCPLHADLHEDRMRGASALPSAA